MIYYKLGTSELTVSEIAFGAMSLGDSFRQNKRLLHQAYDRGINFFDTADLYQQGENERTLGRALKGMRQRLVLATKVGNEWAPDGLSWTWNPRKAYIKKAVHASLRRLQTDYIDLYQLHGGTLEDPIDETIEAFEELKREGHIRYYGISSIRPNVIREWTKRAHLTSVMMQYSLLDRRPEETCLDLLSQANIAVIVRGALAKGLLVDKDPRAYLDHTAAEVAKAQAAISHISSDARTPAQTALQFCVAQDAVTAIAAGASTLEQLRANASASDCEPLTADELGFLREAVRSGVYEKFR